MMYNPVKSCTSFKKVSLKNNNNNNGLPVSHSTFKKS